MSRMSSGNRYRPSLTKPFTCIGSMLRGLLRDSEAAKALFEEFGLFKSPELLEKYVIASEITVEVLDLFLHRVFGTERGSIDKGSGDLRGLLDGLGCAYLSDMKSSGEDSSAQVDELDRDVNGLRLKVQDLERKLCAVQRQLQMQEKVSQLVVSLDARLDEIARGCERRVSDVRLQVSSVTEDVAHLKKDVSERASTGDVRELSEEVLRLKEEEKRLMDRILGAEKKTEESDQALRDEIQGKFNKLDSRVKIAMNPLNGIIAQLTQECGGNVHQKGVVEVTASSGSAENAVELGIGSVVHSNNEPNSWLLYDFKGRCVSPISYSIRSHCGPGFPKSWVLEVSNDGKKWEVVDRRDNNFDLKAEYVTRNFVISDPPCGSFRFVRLLQKGKNHDGHYALNLTSFEIFGALSSK